MTESASVHPTAVVEPGAKLGAGAVVGPQCWVGSEVELGEGVVLVSHVAVAGRTSIGAGTQVYPFASLGHPPQDRKYRGEPSRLAIGGEAVIREHVTMNPGTAGGGMETVVGDHGLFMAGCHVAHDCRIGDHVVLANHATLGGHVTIAEGGLSIAGFTIDVAGDIKAAVDRAVAGQLKHDRHCPRRTDHVERNPRQNEIALEVEMEEAKQ